MWIALPLRADLRIREVLATLQTETVEVRFVPDIYNFTLLHHSMSEIAGLAVINLTDSPLHGVQRGGEGGGGPAVRGSVPGACVAADAGDRDRRQALGSGTGASTGRSA